LDSDDTSTVPLLESDDDRTIMMHRGMIIADLAGEERRGVTEADLLVRFAELRYTAEMGVTREQ